MAVKKRIALRPEMTLGEVFKRFPHTKLMLESRMEAVDPMRDANLTLREYAERHKVNYVFDAAMSCLNNCMVLFHNADQDIKGDESLVYYEIFHNIPTNVTPETERPRISVRIDKEKIGLICDGGLPYLRWVLSDGLNAVRLQQNGPPIEMFTAFQRVSGMSCERIFDHGFLDIRVDGHRHKFDQVHLTPFGYENHIKADPDEHSSLLLFRDRMWLKLSRPGKKVEWILDDLKIVTTTTGKRMVTRHGWDASARCLVYQVVDDRPNRMKERPKAYEGFSDDTVKDFIGANWWEAIQGAVPKHTECWITIGTDDLTQYTIGRNSSSVQCTEVLNAQEGNLHVFSGDGSGCLFIGIGSTRKGALTELEAAREGEEQACLHQGHRYKEVVRRSPHFEIEGQPLLTEAFTIIPLFLESLKTGSVLMRSRPHTGAVCGGWDQVLITAPMMRAGDYEIPPRYLEHWLHQFQLDGQVFHVSDFDLSPAILFERWDFDDFMYLLVAAQWIVHTGDTAMLERLAPKCIHMLRVMIRDADPELGLIPCRGIFPDWPPLEVGRKGVAYPSMEAGVWYEALRWWEGLTEILGETHLAEQIRSTAKKIRSNYVRLYFDPDVGMLCDAVIPKTLQKVRTYAVWSLTPFHGSFGHELLYGFENRIAEYLLDKHVNLAYPAIKTASEGEFPTMFENQHWLLFDHMVAKVMRRGNSCRGLEAVLKVIERQYQWFHCALESVNAYHTVTNEEISEYSNWFGWSAAGWYESLLSGAAGIWEEPGGIIYIPADMRQDVKLTNLPYRGGVWDISITGKGKSVSRFVVDGVEVPGACKVPEPYLTGGRHTLEIQRSDFPASPFLLDSVGLRLIRTELRNDGLHVSLAGPGRALVRFFSPSKPVVELDGTQCDFEWQEEENTGVVEISASYGNRIIRILNRNI